MEQDAERYRALKKWLLENGIVTYHALPTEETEPFVMGADFYGETFEAAVDTISFGKMQFWKSQK